MTESKTTDVSPLRITIVGAGLAGLSAAISCALTGHHVLVTESAKELAEVCIASRATTRFPSMLTGP
jgi:salicylate hydroxylase